MGLFFIVILLSEVKQLQTVEAGVGVVTQKYNLSYITSYSEKVVPYFTNC